MGSRCLIECIPCSRLIDPFLVYRTGSRVPTTVTTVRRMPPKARSDPDEEDSSSEGDDPVIAAYVSFFPSSFGCSFGH